LSQTPSSNLAQIFGNERTPYARGGQLIWLWGHFEKVAYTGVRTF